MSNPWFRLYAEFACDPKVQMLTETQQRRYIMLLCLRCSNGYVTLQDSEVAFQLRISNDEWSETKAVFIEKNIITNDNKPTAWDRRQYISDSSTSRVYKHREKKKRPCNVTVTPPDTDTDTDTDTDKHPSSKDVGQSSKPERKKFTPPTLEEVAAYCRERGNAVDPQNWLDHYTANGWKVGKNPMKDWRASVRTWEKPNGTQTPQRDDRTRAERHLDTLRDIANESIERERAENGGVVADNPCALDLRIVR